MPALSRWMIRSALVHLVLGFAVGALLLARKGLGLFAALPPLLPVHVELLVMGWTLQLAMGTAYWILPRPGKVRPRAGLATAAFALILAGVWTVSAGSLFLPVAAAALPAGRLLEALGALLFGLHAWPRVMPPR